MTRHLDRAVAILCVTALLAACGSGAPLRTYVLGDTVPISSSVLTSNGLPTIELRTVSVPDYLDSSDILRRTGPNELTASPAGRWGDRLSQNITQALAEALTSRLSGVVISTEPGLRPTRRLIVDVDRFEIAADGSCVIDARWRITAGDTPATLASERGSFTDSARSTSDAAVAAALSRDIDALATRIVKTMQLTTLPTHS